MADTFTFSERVLYRADCGTCDHTWHESPDKADLVEWTIDHAAWHEQSRTLAAALPSGTVYRRTRPGHDLDFHEQEAINAGMAYYEFQDRVWLVRTACRPAGWEDGVVRVSDLPA